MKNKYFRPTALAVLAFIIFWIFIRSQEAAAAETIVEVAPVVAYKGDPEKGQFAIMLHERFDGKYDVGVILLQDTQGSDGNRAIEGLRTVKWKGVEAGIGFAFWSNVQPQAWNTNQTFALAIGYQWDHFGIRWRHWSTGGTSSKNSGMDMLTVGWKFE